MAEKTVFEGQFYVNMESSRLEDIEEEESNSNPIIGLQEAPNLSFTDALKHWCDEDLLLSMEGLGTHISWAAEYASRKPEDRLSKDQIAAIHLYTQQSPVYCILNTHLRAQDRMILRPVLPFLKLLLSGIYLLTPTKELVYRGINMNLATQLIENSTHLWWAFTSTTRKLNVLENEQYLCKNGRRTMLEIQACCAYDISRYSAFGTEQELILPPGSKLQVKGVLPTACGSTPGLTIVAMTQCPYEPLSLQPKATGVSFRPLSRPDQAPRKLTVKKELEEHSSSVNCVAVSGDGRYIVSGSSDTTVKVWRTGIWDCAAELSEHDHHINSVVVSGNGQYIVSGSSDNSVRVWRMGTWECIAVLKGHSEVVLSVAASADGFRIISGSGDKTVRLWNLKTKQCEAVLKGHTNPVNCVTMSADGRYFVSGGSDNTIIVWMEENIIAKLMDHRGSVNSIAFSKDGRQIVSGSSDNTVRVWELETLKLVVELSGHGGCVRSVAVIGNGQFILSGSDDRTIRVWDMNARKCALAVQGHSGNIMSVVMSDDGQYIVSGSRDSKVWVWSMHERD